MINSDKIVHVEGHYSETTGCFIPEYWYPVNAERLYPLDTADEAIEFYDNIAANPEWRP
jgi:hypothetical protein